MIFPFRLNAQSLLDSNWTQSYSTHETASVLAKDEFALCFGVNNFYQNWSTERIGGDLLLYDIMVRYGVFDNLEVGLKYSHPNAALLRVKRNLLDKYKLNLKWTEKPISIAAMFGFAHYKLTNQDYDTDYIIDLYPGLILDMKIYKKLSFYFAPKFIYSFFIVDKWARDRDPWKTERCYQYGYCWGFSLGERTTFTFENTWHWVTHEDVDYKIHMHGVSFTRIF
jgi:hypothetical protein